jgi:hypothetical protein
MEVLSQSISDARTARGTDAWQTKLLPFMLSILLLLTVFCCAANLYQVHVVQQHIQQAHEVDLSPSFTVLKVSGSESASERLAFARWQSLATLESSALESRYHEAGLMLMTRIYIVFLGFTTGMVLALVGATFILGKLREPPSTAGAEGAAGKISFASTSPGLMLAFFGMVLMLATIWARTEVSVTDKSLYTAGPSEFSSERQTNLGGTTAQSGEGAAASRTSGADAAKEGQKQILQHVKDNQPSAH